MRGVSHNIFDTHTVLPHTAAVTADLGEDALAPDEKDSSATLPLITEHDVLLGTAAARALPRRTVDNRLVDALRRVFASLTTDVRSKPRDCPRRYSYLEHARMAREMDRL